MMVRDTWLHLGARHTTLTTAPAASVTLAIGAQALAESIIRHEPPTPVELEQAIDHVEDALMAARLPRGDGGRLISTAPILRELPGLESVGSLLRRDAVEGLFQYLTSAALGGSGGAALPKGRAAQAALLILRECMHHLDYEAIVIGEAHPHSDDRQ